MQSAVYSYSLDKILLGELKAKANEVVANKQHFLMKQIKNTCHFYEDKHNKDKSCAIQSSLRMTWQAY